MTSHGGEPPFYGWRPEETPGPDAGQASPPPPLPPELHPRGRRAGRAEQRAAAAAAQPAAAKPARSSASQPSGRPGSRSAKRSTNRNPSADLRRGATLGAMTISALLSVAIVLGSGYAWYTWKGLNSNIRRLDAIPASSVGGKAGASAAPDVDGTDQNILIVGNDDRDTATAAELKALGTNKDGGSYNTDTMMILHAPADGKSASVISLPRDSWVSIPGHGMGKLNSAYPDGVSDGHGDKATGAQLMVKTIENLTGLHIDHYVQVDLIGFYRISKAIGGVTVNLCKAAKDHYSGIDLPAGKSTISGTQALAFVRQRHGLPASDFDRIKRQQYFISAAFQKISSAGTLLNPFTLNKLITAVTSSLTMDESLQLTKLASQFQGLAAGNINTQTIPTNGTGMEGNQSVVEVDPATVRAFAQSIDAAKAKPTPTPKPSSTVTPSSVTLTVLNAGAANGAATSNGAALSALGFNVSSVGSATTTTRATTVEYPSGDEAQAQAVAAHIPGAALKETSSVSQVTLLLGSDGASVGGTATSGGSSSASATPKPSPTPNAAATGACIN
ncbi:LytR family transcriptional attenuator [Jatrophihabitans sp. GAS493]|uniref:LCP family protein n=1 Tax=Jatrophihabitans sp. GAS493 TaxID=1907575 RepID=UPI000BB8BE02|nr:LCP family protein [Jatrophihabitans sp. GAS493]SOD72997.1 LytR family transcriptional attenuator [Jatrophihabitans sp. GAS493]